MKKYVKKEQPKDNFNKLAKDFGAKLSAEQKKKVMGLFEKKRSASDILKMWISDKDKKDKE